MKKELFNTYKTVLLRSINSCINTDQLTCCVDMIDRMDEQFRYCIEPKERAAALDEMSAAYLQKQNELAV